MMRLIVFCFMLPFPIFAQNAQDTLRQLYDRQTLTFLSDGVMQNAETKPIGTKWFKEDPFIAQLKTVPSAYDAYKKGNRQAVGALGTFIVSGPALMIGLGTINVSNTPQSRNFTYTALGIGTAFAALTFSKLHKGHTHYHHALWQYNRAAILRGYPDGLQKEKIGDLYDRTTIRLTGTGYIQNGMYQNRGFYNQKMTAVFANNVVATRHLQKSKRATLFYKPLQKLGLLGGTYGLGHLLTYEYHSRSQLKTAGYSILIGGALTLISIPLQIQSEDHLARAVWLYNRDILTR